MTTHAFDNTLGAAFCGFAVSAVLYGILSAQVFAYFQRYRLDRPVYKCLVSSIWVLETLHQVLVAHTVYFYTISNFTSPLALLFPVWSVIIQVTIGAFISVIVKACFAMRVWRFSNHNIPLVAVIAIMTAAELGLAFAFTAESFTVKTFVNLPKLKILTTVTLGVGVLTDIVIAASLVWSLHHLRSGHPSDSVVNGLIRYSIETGALTSICGICTLVAFDTMPENFVYMSFFFVLSKLYSNSLLATLNTRAVIRGRGTNRERVPDEEFTIIHPTHLAFDDISLGQIDPHKPLDLEGKVRPNFPTPQLSVTPSLQTTSHPLAYGAGW